jgi:hypothetical protein
MHAKRILVGTMLSASLIAHPVASESPPHDLRSVFFIARSTNRNQVHYGLRVDGGCNPLGTEPVYGYWRMLEKQGEVEPILAMEMPAYGLRDAQLVEPRGTGKTIRVRLRAFPDRAVFVTVTKAESGCSAVATTTIDGAEARLSFVYVKLKWPFGIDYVLLRGTSLEGGPIEEVVRN